MKLSEDLKYWRAERPDEWTMDEFIRKAVKLEGEILKHHVNNLEEVIVLCNNDPAMKQFFEQPLKELAQLLNRG